MEDTPGGEAEEEDEDAAKVKGSLSQAIVMEKLNVHVSRENSKFQKKKMVRSCGFCVINGRDVAGLHTAKNYYKKQL